MRILAARLRLIFWVLFLCCCWHACESYQKSKIGNLEIDFGAKEGLDDSSMVSQNTLQKILKGVENGNKENIYFYGLLKLYGISVTREPTVAAEHFLRASNLGHMEATTAYGVSLATGTGVPLDEVAAVRFFRKGTQLKDPNAYWLLGTHLLEGKGAKPSYAEAAVLFRKAAEDANIPQAQHALATMYEYGRGVETNFQLAAKFYKRAAEQNHVESIYYLALMYAYGREGIAQDYTHARALFESATRFNHAPSIYYIGVFKAFGYGCKVDYHQAINWFERAAALDDYRVSPDAARSAKELREFVEQAHRRNEEVLNQLTGQAERHSDSAHEEGMGLAVGDGSGAPGMQGRGRAHGREGFEEKEEEEAYDMGF